MVDEEKPVEDGEVKEQPKKGGRPSKRAAAKPDPEPAANEQREDTAAQDGEKEPAEESESAEKVEDNSTAPDGRVVQEGEEFEINTREENGIKVAAENTYLKKRLPKSSRYTYILLAVEGAPQ